VSRNDDDDGQPKKKRKPFEFGLVLEESIDMGNE